MGWKCCVISYIKIIWHENFYHENFWIKANYSILCFWLVFIVHYDTNVVIFTTYIYLYNICTLEINGCVGDVYWIIDTIQ